MASANTLRLAWRNLGRNRKRSILAFGAIALGQLTFLATSGLLRGYSDQFFRSVTGPLVGHVQVHAPGWRDDRSLDLFLGDLEATLGHIRQVPGVERASPRLFAPALAALSEEGFMSVVVGVDPATEAQADGLLAGQEVVGKVGRGRVLVGRSLARRRQITPGTELALVGQDVDGSIANDLFTVADIISSQVEIVNTLGVVMSLADAQELFLMPDQAHEIVIHLADPELVDSTAVRLASLPVLADTEVLPWQKIAPQFVAMIQIMDGYVFIILCIVFIAAAAGIANTMLMSTFERTHEFGMLLSLGCGPARLSRVIVVEAVILGLVGVALGTALGVGFLLWSGASGLDYAALGGGESSYEVGFKGIQFSSVVYPRVHPQDVIAGIVAVVLTSFVAAVWPMLHLARLEPMEAMRA